ncbi:MAG: hypothetical protein KDA51_19645, partial [Planctomycetales bacterium]|nr:hypothetical protein [Planctomycetales bacterium]
IAAWNTRTPPEPATDAELVELAAKAAAMSQSKRMRGNEREWQVYLCEGLRADVRAVIAAITPAIRAQERAKIVTIIQDEQATRERLASEHHDYTARYHNECRAMECANLVTLIEQGTHDNG